MVIRTDCPCGKADLSSAQMTMHNRSKARQGLGVRLTVRWSRP